MLLNQQPIVEKLNQRPQVCLCAPKPMVLMYLLKWARSSIFHSCILMLAISTGTAQAAKNIPLFESEELLEITISGALDQLDEDRDTGITYKPATITYQDTSGKLISVNVELHSRGEKRLSQRTCSFPPIRIEISKAERSGTLFDGKKKWKLTTQCQPKFKNYENYLITEYLSYKIFNLLTDNSYLVRLAKINYFDIPGNKTLHTTYGFFLEPTKALAKRIGRKRIKVNETSALVLDGKYMNIVSLFHFMLGSTDWSATHGGREECCHNGKLFGEVDGSSNLYIPYDLDMTGLVNPEYATYDPALRLDSIRDRRYRGYCRNLGSLDTNIALFNSNQAGIVALFENTPYLSNAARKKKINYLNQFFRIINDSARVERKIYGRCHKSIMVETGNT